MTADATSRGITHVGLTVPDLDRAIAWYADVLGWKLTMGPVELGSGESFTGRQVREVFRRSDVRFRLAHLDPGGEAVIELFEFSEPASGGSAGFEFWRTGVFHVCLRTDDIDELSAAIAQNGGEKLMDVQPIVEGEPFQMCYCADPFGNILELYSHDHREVFGGRSDY
jgi:catechol 2,3-dioxygenase-like lactoylglutathione lyase family enzyme